MEKRKKALISWIKDNKTFLLILILGIAIRLYYFSLTYNQPLWWDEADYLAYAKNLAGLNSDWIITEQHNSIFPYFVALFFVLNLSEAVAKFTLELIPSVLLIVLTYFIVLKMYSDKRIALVASFIMAVFWDIIFNSMKFHLEAPALLTAFLAIYVFWQGYEKKEKIFGKIEAKWAIPLAVFFITLTYMIRRGYSLFGFFILVYMLLTKNWKDLIKDKFNWIGLGVFAVMFFISEKLIFTSGIGDVASTYTHVDKPINFLPFDVFKSYFFFGNIWTDVLFYLFWVGFIYIILRTLMYTGHIKTTKDESVRSDLFSIISLIIILSYFIFVLRTQNIFGESRWYFPLLLASFICISRASVLISDYLGKYGKHIGVIALIILLGLGGYGQIIRADMAVKAKIDSFEGTREAGLLLKEISGENDIIVSQPVPQVIYYSERKVLQPEQIAGAEGNKYPPEQFLQGLENNPDAKYLLISFSEPGHPDWMVRTYTSNGAIAGWEILLTDTRVNFVTGEQDIKEEVSYGDITFKLVDIKRDVFIYEIIR